MVIMASPASFKPATVSAGSMPAHAQVQANGFEQRCGVFQNDNVRYQAELPLAVQRPCRSEAGTVVICSIGHVRRLRCFASEHLDMAAVPSAVGKFNPDGANHRQREGYGKIRQCDVIAETL